MFPFTANETDSHIAFSTQSLLRPTAAPSYFSIICSVMPTAAFFTPSVSSEKIIVREQPQQLESASHLTQCTKTIIALGVSLGLCLAIGAAILFFSLYRRFHHHDEPAAEPVAAELEDTSPERGIPGTWFRVEMADDAMPTPPPLELEAGQVLRRPFIIDISIPRTPLMGMGKINNWLRINRSTGSLALTLPRPQT